MPSIYTGESSTAYSTSAKTVTISGFSLETGVLVAVKFTAEILGTLTNPTLNVSSTGAKSITYDATELTFTPGDSLMYLFQYDGTKYVVVGYNYETSQAPSVALSCEITSSAGTVFITTSVATTLTAHVYANGLELNATQIAELGTIRWYNADDLSTVLGTGQTYTIQESDNITAISIRARLEGAGS